MTCWLSPGQHIQRNRCGRTAAEEVQNLVSLMIHATDGIPFPSRMNSM